MRSLGGSAAAVALALATTVAPPIAITPAHAATPWYQVEVVVFAQGREPAWDRGNWREAGPPPIAPNTVELLAGLSPADAGGGTGRRHAFRALPSSALDLGAAVDRLDRSSDYRVLLHVGWHQPGFREEDARAVHLSTSRGLVAPGRFPASAEEAVDGTIRMWRRRFLHVHADVAFGAVDAWREREGRAARDADPSAGTTASPQPGSLPPAGGTAPDTAVLTPVRTPAVVEGGALATTASADPSERLRVARLTRTLRLRGGRLHYLDHPLFGALLLVKRLR